MMETISSLLAGFISQLQSPTLAFLFGGMIIAALGSKLVIPDAIYKFCVFVLLMRIGIGAGMKIVTSDPTEIVLPALFAVLTGLLIVFIGSIVFRYLPGVKREDGVATAGIFGAVSASSLAAAMSLMEEKGIEYEGWAPALYPFMDIPALILAIVLANVYLSKQKNTGGEKVEVWSIIKDSVQSSAVTALLLGLALGLFANVEKVFDSFYDPLFRGLLSILMLSMGIEAYQRLGELRRVAHWYAVYAFIGPFFHGLLGFGLGYIAHITMGFSPGGVVILAVMASSNSDISGPPTLRAAIPSANPSCYVGASTGVGTPVAIGLCIPFFITLGEIVF